MKRFAIRSLCAAVPLLLAGCDAWPVPDQNPDRTSHNPSETTITAANVDQLQQRWTWADDKLGPASVSAPVASEGGIQLTVGCYVVTLDPATGSERWATPLVEDQFNCEAPAGGGMSEPYTLGAPGGGTDVFASLLVIVPTSGRATNFDYYSQRLDAATGATKPGGALFGMLGAMRGTEFVSTRHSEAFLLPADQMTIANLDGTTPGRTLSLATFSDIGPSAGTATIGTGDLVFQSGTGAMTTTPGPSTHHNGVRAFSKTTATPGCTVSTPHPNFPTVDLECPAWVNPLNGTHPSQPVLDNARGALFVTAGGTLYALDQATGTTLWTAAGAGGTPALAGGVLYAPTDDGRVLLFDAAGCGAATCAPIGVLDTGVVGDVHPPAVAGDVVYATVAGTVHAFPKAGCGGSPCNPLWSDAPGGTFLGQPVVNRGQVYVSTGAALIAYGLPG